MDACGEIERPSIQDGGHLIGDNEPPVPYSSTPGTSGWHSSGAPPTGIHSAPLTDPQIVSVLHVGGVVAVYDADRIGDDQLAELEQLARDDERLTVAPYEGGLPTPLSLLGWGYLQRCDAVDVDTISDFVELTAGAADGHTG
ncbi:MAG: DUF3105 domain-containing protein [Nitriliruptorales bacterium]|nr:DUF3105 domain-containing protein [Nitriliruptorales bacterium]